MSCGIADIHFNLVAPSASPSLSEEPFASPSCLPSTSPSRSSHMHPPYQLPVLPLTSTVSQSSCALGATNEPTFHTTLSEDQTNSVQPASPPLTSNHSDSLTNEHIVLNRFGDNYCQKNCCQTIYLREFSDPNLQFCGPGMLVCKSSDSPTLGPVSQKMDLFDPPVITNILTNTDIPSQDAPDVYRSQTNVSSGVLAHNEVNLYLNILI
ncbi:unnamed protein product [Protopolystoma xenopodis]|uniref:Uncharacterized protein n=1 Tax=Protopolystoma xenopodis TaxID=117903 RepID=A0A3S5APZ9_9PLAT|nr:unnamed protein product [Protopolystoma xenopodis]